jgi:hypothetical protein
VGHTPGSTRVKSLNKSIVESNRIIDANASILLTCSDNKIDTTYLKLIEHGKQRASAFIASIRRYSASRNLLRSLFVHTIVYAYINASQPSIMMSDNGDFREEVKKSIRTPTTTTRDLHIASSYDYADDGATGCLLRYA